MPWEQFGDGAALKSQPELEVKEAPRKERVQMKDARLGIHMWYNDQVMFGVPLDHPNSRLNGKIITTSPVIKHSEIEVETLNTIYVIQNWEKPYGT